MYILIKLPVFLSICCLMFLNINFFFFLVMTYSKPKQGLTMEAVLSGVDVLSQNLQFFGNSFVVK